ncbi:MAG TPA: hypothetical protein VI077_01225 [Pseudolabrys sp.]|jgi:hypothetical protein
MHAIYEWRDFVTAGGLMNYGINLADSYRQAVFMPAAFSRERNPLICRLCGGEV